MSTKSKILKAVKNLKFFDSNLKILSEKVYSLQDKSDIKLEQRLYRESILVRKLLTIHLYVQCADTYDIVENPKQIITKANFKKSVTSEYAGEQKDGRIVVGGIECQYMSEGEFDTMLEVYLELKR